MSAQWFKEGLSDERPEFERLNETSYIQRRNFQKVESENDGEKIDGYTCDSRIISKATYERFMEELGSPSNENVKKEIGNVIKNQQLSDENTLTIMAAIADLYETIAALSGIT